MGALGILLLVTAISDIWIAIWRDRHGRPSRMFIGAVGVFLSLALVYLAGGRIQSHWFLVLSVLVALMLWTWPQSLSDSARNQSRTIFLGGVLVLGGLFYLTAGYWAPFSGGVLSQLLEHSPFELLSDIGVEGFLLYAGLAGLQFETGNILVRRILTATGVSSSEEDPRMKAGRIIGPIERVLIFAFAVAGQLAAAALIASAKSILRFPEVTQAARNGEGRGEGDGSTEQGIPLDPFKASEYYLLGSLASWAIAIIPVLLVTGIIGS